MILTKEIEFKANKGNKGSLKKMLQIEIIIGQIYIVPIEKLLQTSKMKVKIKCDKCDKEKEIQYRDYYLYTKGNSIEYLCVKCCKIRTKKTCIEKYGVENPQQNIKIREKSINTSLEKYGVDNPSKNKDVIKKIKKTFNEKYGVDNIFQLDDVKNKINNTFNIKYGGHPSKDENVKRKNIETCLKKYGCTHYTQTDEYKIRMGIILDKDIKDKWILYKRNSRRLFDKIKDEVYKNWNGYDFYDNEYIKENLNLSYKDKNYPTIDHKISVYYGFINNIPVEDINKIENLVITKKFKNSSKGK